MTKSQDAGEDRDGSNDIGPRLVGWYYKVQIIAVIAVVVAAIVVMALR